MTYLIYCRIRWKLITRIRLKMECLQLKLKKKSRTKRKPPTTRSDVWDEFTKFKDEATSELKSKCKHRGSIFSAASSNGTSSMRKHLDKVCKKNPSDDSSQKQIISMKTQSGGDSLAAVKIDAKIIRKTMAEMIIIDELPFKHVDGLGFQRLMALAFPKFKLPSRFTVQRDCFGIFCSVKRRLKNLFMRKKQRVCLTTDTWTSMQKVNFMWLTAHYIDDDWKLCKKLLSFTPITSHRGKDIGHSVEKCLRYWGIENIFTVTADNASSNDVAIDYLKDEFSAKEGSVLNCKYLHMRCVAHILNLVVRDGLNMKHLSTSIKIIRDSVKYVKHSPARLTKFRECMEMENDGNKAELTLDVSTRWNLTYMMLDAALKHEKVWKRYEKEDRIFAIDLAEENGVPDANDWSNARKLHTFLRHFYEFTVKISGSKYVTSNLFYDEPVALNGTLKSWIKSDNEDLSTIASKMQEKFDKYWGDPLKMNKLIFIGAVLDPRFKLRYVEFTVERLYEDVMTATRMKRQLRDAMYDLFNNYREKYVLSSNEGCPSDKNTAIISNVSEENQSSDVSQVWLNGYMTQYEMLYGGSSAKSELDVYLEEARVSGGQKFDILLWWKGNCVLFPVLSQMARDVLAVPVSTVTSESVFSTGGRVLDAFRSSLSPLIAEALLCAQDWLPGSFHSNDVEESDDNQERLSEGYNFSFFS